jgi:hypothetical protein
MPIKAIVLGSGTAETCVKVWLIVEMLAKDKSIE